MSIDFSCKRFIKYGIIYLSLKNLIYIYNKKDYVIHNLTNKKEFYKYAIFRF